MLLWKHSSISLAMALCAFHHIHYNNKHNKVGGERVFLKEHFTPKLKSLRSE